MKICLTLLASDDPLVALAAGERPRAQQEAILAFFMVVLGLYHGMKFANPLKLATKLFEDGGKPSYAKSTMAALVSKKPVPPFSIRVEDFDAVPKSINRAALAKAIMQATVKGSKQYLTVCRLAYLTNNQEVAKAWSPPAVPPKKTTVKATKEYQNQLKVFFKDKATAMIRAGSTLQEVIATLNSYLSSPEFRAPKITGLGVFDTGQLHMNGDPLMTMKGSPCTIWALRGAKITKPLKTGKGKEHQYVFAWQTPQAVSVAKAYKKSTVKHNALKGWHAVSELSKKLPKVKKAWMTMLKQGKALGALFHFAYLTSCRIGSEAGRSAGEVTFGGSTLTCGHVRIKGNTTLISYVGKGQGGKGQVLQQHKLTKNAETRELLDYIQNRVAGGTKQDLLFTDNGRPFSNSTINAWIQQFVPKATVHKFRKLRGTQAAEEILSELTVPEGIDQEEAERLFKASMEKVGDILGHYSLKGNTAQATAATAIKHYIDPAVSSEWFTNLGLDIPAFVPDLNAD